MARQLCAQCQRPQRVCLCHAVQSIEHCLHLVFLQHPLEQHHVKGTAYLTYRCLQQAEFFVGEQFSPDIIKRKGLEDKRWFLLYPDPEQQAPCVLPESLQGDDLHNIGVIVLDGTWKKTKKMLYLNPWLAALPRIQLQPEQVSAYHIRKQKNHQSLATAEAVALLLQQVEQNPRAQDVLAGLMQALVAQHEQIKSLANRVIE